MLIALTGCQSQPTYQAYSGPAKSAGEEARVLIPRAFNLLNVDGDSYTQPLVGNGTLVKLLPGSHKIVIKYVDFWAADPDTDEKITSQPMLLAFDANAGETYKVPAPELKDIKSARQYAENPKVDILNSRNQSVATDIKYQLKDKGLIAAFVDSLSPDKPAASPTPSSSSEDGKQTGPALEMLKYWWQKADAQQQEDFMKWVVE
jgi:uncharacterized protein YccT (UPF0319 family)